MNKTTIELAKTLARYVSLLSISNRNGDKVPTLDKVRDELKTEIEAKTESSFEQGNIEDMILTCFNWDDTSGKRSTDHSKLLKIYRAAYDSSSNYFVRQFYNVIELLDAVGARNEARIVERLLDKTKAYEQQRNWINSIFKSTNGTIQEEIGHFVKSFNRAGEWYDNTLELADRLFRSDGKFYKPTLDFFSGDETDVSDPEIASYLGTLSDLEKIKSLKDQVELGIRDAIKDLKEKGLEVPREIALLPRSEYMDEKANHYSEELRYIRRFKDQTSFYKDRRDSLVAEIKKEFPKEPYRTMVLAGA